MCGISSFTEALLIQAGCLRHISLLEGSQIQPQAFTLVFLLNANCALGAVVADYVEGRRSLLEQPHRV